jgi:outer membrane protein OmpA-like peptidoglycan-associated protein
MDFMKISSIGMGLLLAAALSGRALAQQETDYVAGSKALPLQQSAGTARAMGMGSAVVGVSQGAASLLWNPAGLGLMDCKEVSLHHNSGLGGTIQEIGIIGIPLGGVTEHGDGERECSTGGSHGGIAASLGYVNYGSNFNGLDANGNPTGSYQAGEYSASLGYGKEVLPHLSAGVALAANKSFVANTDYYGYTADVGLLWNVIPNLDLGLTYNNFNLANNIGGNQPAGGVRAGAGYTMDRHLLLALSTEVQDLKMSRLQMGVEYLIGNLVSKYNVVALRAGYVFTFPDAQLTGLTGLTLGLGYNLTREVVLDYAFLPTGDLGISHRLSATYKFGCPRDKHERAAPVAAPAAAVVRPKLIIAAVTLGDAHFDFDKTTLKPSTEAILKENIQLLKEHPQATVEVSGYASASGTETYNQTLSELRAKAVGDYFVKEGGIDPARITTVGYGESRPKTIETNPADIRSKAAKSNMRVIFEIVEH